MKTKLLKKLRRQAARRIIVQGGPGCYEVREDGRPAVHLTLSTWRFSSLDSAKEYCDRCRRRWIEHRIREMRGRLY